MATRRVSPLGLSSPPEVAKDTIAAPKAAAKEEQLEIELEEQRQRQVELELEAKIIELLTNTRLTFKQIVNRLQGEQKDQEALKSSSCSIVSINLIRKINRDNRFRRPRYDSKLTGEQRALLLEDLMQQCAGGTMRPNLSQLAKKFGVCHGSIWYWWDKLNKLTGQSKCSSRIRRQNGDRKSGNKNVCAKSHINNRDANNNNGDNINIPSEDDCLFGNKTRSTGCNPERIVSLSECATLMVHSESSISLDNYCDNSLIACTGMPLDLKTQFNFKDYKSLGRVECRQNSHSEFYLSLPIVMLTRLDK